MPDIPEGVSLRKKRRTQAEGKWVSKESHQGERLKKKDKKQVTEQKLRGKRNSRLLRGKSRKRKTIGEKKRKKKTEDKSKNGGIKMER